MRRSGLLERDALRLWIMKMAAFKAAIALWGIKALGFVAIARAVTVSYLVVGFVIKLSLQVPRIIQAINLAFEQSSAQKGNKE